MGMHYKEIDLFPKLLQFSVFDSCDVKKLSVVKIITGLTFDGLGRSLPGGLYDSAMGTYGKSRDPCSTCLSMSNCSGHFGHIELNALVYNPFFIKTIYEILRISCLHCKRLQFSEYLEKIITLQLQLIDAGYIVEAEELELCKSEYVEVVEKEKIKTESGDILHPKIAEAYELLKKNLPNCYNNTKTTCAVRTAIIHSALHQTLSKKCIHCRNVLRRVKYSFKKLLTSISKAELETINEQAGKNHAIQTNNKILLADECRQCLRDIFENYSVFLPFLFPVLKNNCTNPVDIFFMNVIPVTPPKSRPINVIRDNILEHPQTSVYRNILETNAVLRSILTNIKKKDNVPGGSESVYKNARGSTSYEKIYYAWQELQAAIDQLLDVNLGKDKTTSQGLKQILEKKEGLIRKHMMGKRVNYAARTVITPDPNINVEEVGIPDIFARKLSYPVPVTSWNVSELRKMVMNGPEFHPGANYIEDEKGHKILIPSGDSVKRESLAKVLFTNPENGIKIVHRHLINGDILLLNRQPTLHRPSIMAHKARILEGEKTFRLHYSNCKSYNADFDGDEMNAHLPQSEVARSEAYNLANVANQYLVPKDGSPLGGLIQDHIISGVKLSIRGRFFNKEDYQQLVFQGLSHQNGTIKLLPPTILKPCKLWSGKQILSTIIINLIPKNSPHINLTSTAKINAKSWQTHRENKWICGGSLFKGNEMTETEIVIRGGELLVGVLDKKQYGATPYGLVHCMFELYGGDCSTRLLTSFTKLFTSFLQREGFTLGVYDILVTPTANGKRKNIIKESRDVGNFVVASALDCKDTSAEIIMKKMDEEYVANPKFRLVLDRKYKTILDEYTNDVNRCCLPGGLINKFPFNNLQLMVLSGAKGSMVNTMQISCLLGQIELEGKRPPLMISGKSLPSFATFETSPKSGGFIDGRFMTGIQPQDFFFHCMAGREGLIDTAVKTSRSGYLQRCLIKHLEGINVNYDMTVRDSDNSVVQFLYGEDGMDISKSKFFNKKSLKFLDENDSAILHMNHLKDIGENDEEFLKIQRCMKKLKLWRKKHGNPTARKRSSSFQQFSSELRREIEIENPDKLNKSTGRLNIDEKIINLWIKADVEKKNSYLKKHRRCADPIISKYSPNNYYGAISEYIEELIQSYSNIQPHRKDEIRDILYLKSMKSVVSPGEPVGLLAAQSVGEPSTQMTLNTFHFAGRGEMNVTLGIPRLREILMLASRNIKTPSMDIPFKTNEEKNIDKLRIKLNKVTLADVIEYVNIKICLLLRPERCYQYEIYIKFLPQEAYQDKFYVKPKKIVKYVCEEFFKTLFRAIGRSNKNKFSLIDIDNKKSKENLENDNVELEDGGTQEDRIMKGRSIEIDESSDNEDYDEDDATGIKLKSRKQDENDYDDPEEQEELEDANDDNDAEKDVSTDDETMNNLNDADFLQIVMNNERVNDYNYDRENYLWCKLTFNLSMKYKKFYISSILKEVAKRSVIYQVGNIKRAITYTHKDEIMLKTEGINIVEMFKYNKQLDLNRLYSNDIHAVAKTYGIEAAARVVVKEIKNVFNVYGITVDVRHLLLIADYMTFDGNFQPLSRKGMACSSSPCQQMSFESSLQFLKTATIFDQHDDLSSPSGRLMVGLPIKHGTGSFSLLTKFVS